MTGQSQRAEHSDAVHMQYLQQIARLRMIIGFLGEKGQHNWWPSEFLSATAPAFLNPVFGKTSTLAQYHAVKEVARRVHDEHIGVGRVFHLFRLPESTEQAVFEMLQDLAMGDLIGKDVESKDAASDALRAIANSSSDLREGPVQIGSTADLDGMQWISDAARCYEVTFNAGSRSFPYLADGA